MRDDSTKGVKTAWRLSKELKLSKLGMADDVEKLMQGVIAFTRQHSVAPAWVEVQRALADVNNQLQTHPPFVAAQGRTHRAIAWLVSHVYGLNSRRTPVLKLTYHAPIGSSFVESEILGVLMRAREALMFYAPTTIAGTKNARAMSVLRAFPADVVGVVQETLNRAKPLAWGIVDLEAPLPVILPHW